MDGSEGRQRQPVRCARKHTPLPTTHHVCDAPHSLVQCRVGQVSTLACATSLIQAARKARQLLPRSLAKRHFRKPHRSWRTAVLLVKCRTTRAFGVASTQIKSDASTFPACAREKLRHGSNPCSFRLYGQLDHGMQTWVSSLVCTGNPCDHRSQCPDRRRKRLHCENAPIECAEEFTALRAGHGAPLEADVVIGLDVQDQLLAALVARGALLLVLAGKGAQR